MPRRYKPISNRKVARPDRPLRSSEPVPQALREINYPSHFSTKPCSTSRPERHSTEGYTIAPAYNKGAYQVISKADIIYIGK